MHYRISTYSRPSSDIKIDTSDYKQIGRSAIVLYNRVPAATITFEFVIIFDVLSQEQATMLKLQGNSSAPLADSKAVKTLIEYTRKLYPHNTRIERKRTVTPDWIDSILLK